MTPAPRALALESLLIGTGLRLFFLGFSVGLGLSLWFLGDTSELALSNMIAPETRQRFIAASFLVALCVCLGATSYVLLSKRRNALLTLNRVARLASPLLLTGLLPSMFDWAAYQNRAFLFAVVATFFGLASERAFRVSLEAAREMGLLSRPFAPASPTQPIASRWTSLASSARPRAPSLILAAMVSGFACLMAVYSVWEHYQLHTYSWDLGIFNNIMYNLLRGHWFKASPVLGPTGSHIQYHATFGAYLFAPFYALYQKPETLLVLQALLVALGAVPLFLIARRRLGNPWVALVFAYVYLVHAPLHGPVFYDFHFLTTSPVFVLTVVYFFETGRRRALIVAWLMAISLREEVSATLAMCALYYLLTGQRPRWALWGGLCSALYFLIVKFVVMPAHGTGGQSFSWIFQGLIAPGDRGFAGVLRTIVTNPLFTFTSVFTRDKFEYLLLTLGPVLLLPLRQRRVWFLCLPAFVFTLLSTGYQPMIETHFQYTANWTPYVMIASVFCLAEWRGAPGGWLRFAAALPALCFVATLFSYNFGAVFQHNTFNGGFHKVSFEYNDAQRRQYAELSSLIDQIPVSAKVSACEVIVPHVSSREDVYTLNRWGAGDADYLLCSTDWLDKAPVKPLMQTALATRAYSFVGRAGIFALWRKGGDHSRDSEGLQLLGPQPRSTGQPTKAPSPPPPAKTKPPSPSGSASPPGSASALGGATPPGRTPPAASADRSGGPDTSTTGSAPALPGMDAKPAP